VHLIPAFLGTSVNKTVFQKACWIIYCFLARSIIF
jgi:hypothetical protein